MKKFRLLLFTISLLFFVFTSHAYASSGTMTVNSFSQSGNNVTLTYGDFSPPLDRDVLGCQVLVNGLLDGNEGHWPCDASSVTINLASYKPQLENGDQFQIALNYQYIDPTYRYYSNIYTYSTVTPTPQPATIAFNASGDTYVRSGQQNENEGGSNRMRVQASGDNRSLVRFDQGAIQGAVGNKQVLSAKLRLNITDNGNNWGATGRTVDVHRLLVNWIEGNGTENSRGTGSGATWNCAIDSFIQNQAKNCSGSSEWEMGQPNNPAVHPWVASPSATQTITNNQTGIVEYDVTVDVASFVNGSNSNYGWLIKKTNENQNGQVSFGTRESSSVPRLVVTYQP